MKKKTCGQAEFSQEERELIERLRQRPEMMARVQSILDIAREAGGSKRADEVEELLVEEMRKLGNSTMKEWAGGAQKRLTQELRAQDATLRSRKKNAEVVDGLWSGGSPGGPLEQCGPFLSAALAGQAGSEYAWEVAPITTCLDGLWLRTFLRAGGAERERALWF